MIKRLASATVLGLLLSGASLAQTSTQGDAASPQPPPATTSALPAETPATAEACIEAAADLGKAAEGRAFTDDKLDRLEQLFSKMETLCDGKQFAEAMTVGKDIRSLLDGQ